MRGGIVILEVEIDIISIFKWFVFYFVDFGVSIL